MIGILMLFVAGCWFWCAFVFITRDHSHRWIEMVLWVCLATLLRLLIALLFIPLGLDSDGVIVEVIGLVVGVVFMYLVLKHRFHVNKPVDVAKILGIYYGGLLIPTNVLIPFR